MNNGEFSCRSLTVFTSFLCVNSMTDNSQKCMICTLTREWPQFLRLSFATILWLLSRNGFKKDTRLTSFKDLAQWTLNTNPPVPLLMRARDKVVLSHKVQQITCLNCICWRRHSTLNSMTPPGRASCPLHFPMQSLYILHPLEMQRTLPRMLCLCRENCHCAQLAYLLRFVITFGN